MSGIVGGEWLSREQSEEQWNTVCVVTRGLDARPGYRGASEERKECELDYASVSLPSNNHGLLSWRP